VARLLRAAAAALGYTARAAPRLGRLVRAPWTGASRTVVALSPGSGATVASRLHAGTLLCEPLMCGGGDSGGQCRSTRGRGRYGKKDGPDMLPRDCIHPRRRRLLLSCVQSPQLLVPFRLSVGSAIGGDEGETGGGSLRDWRGGSQLRHLNNPATLGPVPDARRASVSMLWFTFTLLSRRKGRGQAAQLSSMKHSKQKHDDAGVRTLGADIIARTKHNTTRLQGTHGHRPEPFSFHALYSRSVKSKSRAPRKKGKRCPPQDAADRPASLAPRRSPRPHTTARASSTAR